MTRYATVTPVGLMLLSLGQACGTEFSSCREGEPCSGVATAASGSGGTGGGVGPGAGRNTAGSAAGGGGSTSAFTQTSSSGSLAGEAGAPGAAGDSGGGTTASSGGTGGSVVVIPCDGACDGATPVCDEDTDTCVECRETEDCDEEVCDTAAKECVECLSESDCADPRPQCAPEDNTCVECLDNMQCGESTASWCDDNTCAPCQTNADCAHLAGTTVCDVPTGECVECTPAEEGVCGGTSCNPATNTCTTTELGTVGSCEPCLADSECIGNAEAEPLRRCIPMEFKGEVREQAYCLKRQAAGCERPYAVLITAVSVSGAAEEPYCGIGQDSVTCEAVLDLFQSRSCPGGQDTECGCPRDEDGNCTAPGTGGLCRTVGTFDNQCTYECGVTNDCPSNKTCADQDPDFCQ